LGRLLYTDGFEPVLFRSAEEYLEGASVLCPLCLVLDLNLPGLSGLQLQERLRRTRHGPPVIVITSHRDPAIRALAEEKECAAFIVKPFGATTLLAAIATIDASRSFYIGESENAEHFSRSGAAHDGERARER
jgi:FixJ family two-component response regulator